MLVLNLGILPVTSQPPNTGFFIGKVDWGASVHTAHAVFDGLQIQNKMLLFIHEMT